MTCKNLFKILLIFFHQLLHAVPRSQLGGFVILFFAYFDFFKSDIEPEPLEKTQKSLNRQSKPIPNLSLE